MPQDLVCVGCYSTTELAHVARLALESEGIPSYLDNEWVSSMDWALTNAVGGVKLFVGSLDAESASEILSSPSQYKWEDGEEDLTGNATRDDTETDDSSANVTNEREENALRAFRGSVIGLFFLPLHFYIFYLLVFKVFGSAEPMNAQRKHQAIIATVINIPCVVAMLLFIRSTVGLLNVQ
ncbi:MAG: hypothetical protein ACK5YR_09080 [Pirellula sp.]